MPMAPSLHWAFARTIVALAVLAALPIADGRTKAFAQEARTTQEAPTPPKRSEATENDDAKRDAKRDAETAAGPIDVVELMAGADAPRSRHRGLLARELARQAVLLAAREELGLRTRDRMLREGTGDNSTPGRLLLDAQMTFEKNGDVAVEVARIDGKDRQSLVRSVKRFEDGTTIDYAGLAGWCEELSRGEIAVALRTAAAISAGSKSADESAARGATSRQADGVDEVPADVARRMRRMTFASQFAAIRRLHELAQRDGPSSSASAALARAYAHLGVLSELYWHSSSVAFKARSLLYAQRVVAAPGADAATASHRRGHRGYALALCGLHRAAQDDLTWAERASPDEVPGWVGVARALCEFDDARLGEIPIDADYGEIARVCQVSMAERGSISPEDMEYEVYSAAEKRLTTAALELPHCWRVRAAAGRAIYDVGGRETFDAQWYRDVAATPRLAQAAADIAERRLSADNDVVAEQKSRAELIEALRAAASEDRYEPSLGVLATSIEESSFVDAFEYAQVMGMGYDADETKKAVAQFRGNVVPIVERHPLYPMLKNWLDMVGGGDPSGLAKYDYDGDELLRTVDLSNATTAMFGLLDISYGEPHQGIAGKLHEAIVAHGDDTFGDLAALAIRYDVGDESRYAEKMYAVSPRAPQAIAGTIRYHWPRVADRADEFERRYADHEAVLAMLGSRYVAEKQTADARRCLRAYLELTTTREWTSQWAYRHLADTYRAEGDTRQWLSTLEEFLREDGAVDQRGDVQVLIARHFLAQGDYGQALHYAESVDSYDDTDAQVVVAECREYQRRWLAAEQAYRTVAEDDPYGPQVLLWHRYCAQTGYGSMTTARNAVLGYIRSVDEEDDGTMTEPDALAGIGYFYILENEPATALEWLARAVEAGQERSADDVADPRHALQLVMVAHELGKHERRDVAVDRIVRSGEKFVVDGQPRRELVALANLLQKAFASQTSDAAAAALRFDRAAAEELIATAAGDDRVVLSYVVGRLLDKHAERAAAEEFFRRAVAVPAREASRSLAAVLLRRHGIEPNEIVVGAERRSARTTGG